MAEKENSFTKNFALNQSVSDRFLDEVKNVIYQARQNRRTKEEQWLEDLRLWACVLTDGQQYQGRSNVFIPELHHQIEATVSKYLASTFPNQEYIGVIPMKQTTEEMAKRIKAAVYNELEYKNNIQAGFDIHARQRTIMGTSPWKCSFVNDQTKIYAKDSKGNVKAVDVPKFYGVKWEVVDIFRWYIAPEWATMENCFLMFEDDFIAKSKLESMKSSDGKPMYSNVDMIQEFSMDIEHYWVDSQRLEANLIYNAAEQRPKQAMTTTIYTEFDFDGSGNRVPAMAVLANSGTVLRLCRNPYWMQQAPYIAGRYLRYPTKNYYGFSLPDRLRSLQYQMNDVGNQTMDSLNYSLNPIAIIDPAMAGDPGSFVLQPGAKWFGSPQGISFSQFGDVSGSGFQAMSQIRGMVSQFSDSSTAIAPQLQGKARSATQASVVDREVSQDMKISALCEQIEVLEPMCKWTHALLKQYMSDSQQIRVQGPDFGQWIMQDVSPADIVGEVDFVWQGAQAADKTAIYTQQLMNFYQLAVQATSTIPALQGKVDLVALFDRVATEGFKLDRMDEILTDLKAKKTIAQDVETVAIIDGQDVPVHDGDDDDEHMADIDTYITSHKSLPDKAKLDLLRHKEKHAIQKQAKAKVQEQEAELKALQMSQMGQAGPGGNAGPNTPPPGGGQPGPGNPFQIPQATSQSSMSQGMRAVEPNMGG